MADIAASDITVTILDRRIGSNSRQHINAQMAFGDGALTYPAGGIPISKGALGCPNHIESLTVYDKGTSGYEFSYDRANEKIVMVQQAAQTTVAHNHTQTAHTHALHFNDAEIADGATTRVNVGANLLGANTGGDLAVAGVADTTGHGGIVQVVAVNGTATTSVVAGALAQPSAVAIAAQTIKCEVIGW